MFQLSWKWYTDLQIEKAWIFKMTKTKKLLAQKFVIYFSQADSSVRVLCCTCKFVLACEKIWQMFEQVSFQIFERAN